MEGDAPGAEAGIRISSSVVSWGLRTRPINISSAMNAGVRPTILSRNRRATCDSAATALAASFAMRPPEPDTKSPAFSKPARASICSILSPCQESAPFLGAAASPISYAKSCFRSGASASEDRHLCCAISRLTVAKLKEMTTMETQTRNIDVEQRTHETPAARRRTFAIISHPDAGKTTLTEKLLLYGGAIQLAGEVKAKRNRVSTRSD